MTRKKNHDGRKWPPFTAFMATLNINHLPTLFAYTVLTIVWHNMDYR